MNCSKRLVAFLAAVTAMGGLGVLALSDLGPRAAGGDRGVTNRVLAAAAESSLVTALPDDLPKITIAFADNGAPTFKGGATNKEEHTLKVTIENPKAGKLTAIIDGEEQPSSSANVDNDDTESTLTIHLKKFENKGDQSLKVQWKAKPADNPTFSNTLTVNYDTKGPIAVRVDRVLAAPGKYGLVVWFDDSDIDRETLNAKNFVIHPCFGDKSPVTGTKPTAKDNKVTIPAQSLAPGEYRLIVIDTERANGEGTPLKDLAGNAARGRDKSGSDTFVPFSIVESTTPQIEISYQAGTSAAKNNGLTNDPKVAIALTIIPVRAGTVSARVGATPVSEPKAFDNSNPPSAVKLDLTPLVNRGEFEVVVEWVSENGKDRSSSNSLKFKLDTRGPIAQEATLVGALGGNTNLQIRFDSSDLKNDSLREKNFKLIAAAGDPKDVELRTNEKITREGNIVQIPLTILPTGNYEIEVNGTRLGNDPNTPVQDEAGNYAGGSGEQGKNIRLPFSSYPQREHGPMVHFPDFVKRQTPAEQSEFNPGDNVETRVARLYYFRDAHRVAEIINRNVKSFNRAAVDSKRREAEASRGRADAATDQRRANEREAVQAAQDARLAEREVQKAEGLAARARAKAKEDADNLKRTTEQEDAAKIDQGKAQTQKSQAETDLTKAQGELSAANKETPPNPEKIEAAEKRVNALTERNKQASDNLESETKRLSLASEAKASAAKAVSASAEDLREKEFELNQAQAKLEGQRNREIAKREESLQAEAKEDRAKEDQFRKEVAAAHEDPDTYAPADLNSIDPVCQVSISVIGEGVIQLRGPIRGINKIRTMIDQIDTPVGQVKVGIFTVQVNGEHGDRMEKVAQRIEGNVDVSRFLTSQSMMLLRRAVQEVASQVAFEAERGGHTQIDRDRKYLYHFFGRDFTDELYAMNSEFLYSGNKVLSIHSMDTVSRSSALFITAMAKNSIRQRVLDRFMELVRCELPQAEYDFRKASKVLPCGRNTLRECIEKANELYTFRSLRGMFDVPLGDEQQDMMTPMQREYIRLAQIFKSQMLAEVELKQRIVERGLIQDRANDEEAMDELLQPSHSKANQNLRQHFSDMVAAQEVIADTLADLGMVLLQVESDFPRVMRAIDDITQRLKDMNDNVSSTKKRSDISPQMKDQVVQETLKSYQETLAATVRKDIADFGGIFGELMSDLESDVNDLRNSFQGGLTEKNLSEYNNWAQELLDYYVPRIVGQKAAWKRAREKFVEIRRLTETDSTDEEIERAFAALIDEINTVLQQGRSPVADKIKKSAMKTYKTVIDAGTVESNIKRGRHLSSRTRRSLDHRKLLDFLIDEKEEKYIELREGTKSHIATMDNYLKRLAIALEDDFKVQFYDPAFTEVRKASREWDVNLGQVERTTILTNNRQFAKVSPQATMEFDLPKREILIQEAMKGAKAMVQDYGALLQDPTFLAASKMLSGSPTSSASSAPKSKQKGAANEGQSGPSVKTILPSLPSNSEEQVLNQSSGQERELGAALEALIPDPAIYKFETGTGFEIRPVIQPDGDSIIYDFNYMYTTNVREPVRADEKHLGRVKRHFIDTQVQTSSFELREISRYQVALKVSRTSRGVPLFEDIPGLGVLFRPQPSQESSLQQNIILGQSTVYPTLFDLMGLRWAAQVVDLDHETLRNDEHVARGRRKTIEDMVFEEASDRVDGFLGIKDNQKYKPLRRPDLYHDQSKPSPYHPNGYVAPYEYQDPTQKRFEIPDRRPPEMRDPVYEPLHRQEVPVEPIGPGLPSGSTRLNAEPKLIGPHSWVQTSSNSDGTVILRESQSSGSGVRTAAHEQPANMKTKPAAKTESKPADEDSKTTLFEILKKRFGR